VTNAADPQDIDQASNRIPRGLLALSQALEASDQLQLANSQGLKPVQLDKHNLAALRRLQERAMTTGRELVPLLLTGGIKEWEEFIADSFQHDMSLHLEQSSIKQQVWHWLQWLCCFLLFLELRWLPLDTCRTQHSSCFSPGLKGILLLACQLRWTITHALLGLP
jgi:hypothetical protein